MLHYLTNTDIEGDPDDDFDEGEAFVGDVPILEALAEDGDVESGIKSEGLLCLGAELELLPDDGMLPLFIMKNLTRSRVATASSKEECPVVPSPV
jgi:hypothetical protein